MKIQKEQITLETNDIKEYENNPRINDNAVDDVVESIKQCGYINPIIIDENNIILAGHTRFKALKKLNKNKISVLKIIGLSEEQKKKYRILDNKTAEKAEWDFDKLELEMQDVDFGDYDFGFEEVNNFDENALNNLFVDAPEKQKEKKFITCPHCGKEIEV